MHRLDPAATSPVADDGRVRTGFWREISGALAIGVAALAAVVLVLQLVAWARGQPGPGLVTVAGHLLAAGIAVLGSRFADRRQGWPAAAAVLAVVLVTGAALWTFWWA